MTDKADQQKKKHIAMIGQKHVPSREGGVEIVVWELATRLRDAGYDVDCYNRSGYHLSGKDYTKIPGKRGYYKDGIRIIIIPTFHNSKLNAIVYSLLGTIRAVFGHYDVIHFHAEGPCIMLWLPKLFGIHVIATIHGLDWQRAKWGNFASRMIKAGEKTAAKYADEVIVLSKDVQDYFKEVYGRETRYIPNGISKPERRPARLITEQYGLQGNDYIYTLSRIVPEKGIHYLIEAYSRIQTDKKLVIIGGNGNADDYWNEIRKLAKQDSRIIMTGFIEGEVLQELCSNAYLYILPSDVEGMSVSLLESMSYGNCCLISNIPENLEVVEDKAVFFRQGDVNNLQDILQKLLEHPEEVEEYQKASSDYICSRYSWDKMVMETQKLYK